MMEANELTLLEDDIPVRGNAIVSGDDDFDAKVEDEILARLERGDQWAWCTVLVEVQHGRFIGRSYLGACCYDDEADFKRGGYYEQMVEEAREALASDMLDVWMMLNSVEG
jgi:hypothetical protein